MTDTKFKSGVAHPYFGKHFSEQHRKAISKAVSRKAEIGFNYQPATCQKCGTSFQPRGSNQKYCPKCSVENRRRIWREASKRKSVQIRQNPERLAAKRARMMRSYYKHQDERVLKAIPRAVAWCKNNPVKYTEIRQKIAAKMRKEWYGNLSPAEKGQERNNRAIKAESLVETTILPRHGFKDIFKPPNHFAFDYLAKRDNDIWGIEVSSNMMKQIKSYNLELASYLGWKCLVLLVSPLWDKYALF